MVTDEQVRLLRKKMAEGKTMVSAAATAAMSERSAYVWKEGGAPTDTKEPRPGARDLDPFAPVWASEVVPLLKADEHGVLEATTILAELQRRHGDAYDAPQLRTLQRRMQHWRVLHGPGKEVMFEQAPRARSEGAFRLHRRDRSRITIAGRVFAHLLFQFVLSFSKWRWVGLAFSETFEALVRGLQDALWELGGVPSVWRSDNLSAATHQIPGGGRELNRRFADVLAHYGAKSTRIEPGKSNQNGVVGEGQRHSQVVDRPGARASRQPRLRSLAPITMEFVRETAMGLNATGDRPRRSDPTSRGTAVDATAGVHARYSAIVRQLEHDPFWKEDLLDAFAAERLSGEDPPAPGHHRGVLPR